MNRLIRVSLMPVLTGIVLLLGACERTPDEQRVRAAIEAAALAAEEADAGDFAERLSVDFVGNDGQVDTADLTGLLRLHALRGERITVLLGPITIEPRGERLHASFAVTLGGGGRLLPEQIGIYQVESGWRLEDGQWRCHAASWERAL